MVSYEDLLVPFSSELCTPVIHSAMTLLSQILGLDDYTKVTKAMVGLLLYIGQSGTSSIRFDKFLAKEICS